MVYNSTIDRQLFREWNRRYFITANPEKLKSLVQLRKALQCVHEVTGRVKNLDKWEPQSAFRLEDFRLTDVIVLKDEDTFYFITKKDHAKILHCV